MFPSSYVGPDGWIHTFLTSELGRREWSVLGPGRFTLTSPYWRDVVAAVRLEAVETGKSLLFWEPKRGSLSEPGGGYCNDWAEVNRCKT